MSITIRAGVATDAAALADLAARTFSETFAADNRPEDMALHVAQNYGATRQLKELLDPNIRTLLVDIDRRLAGFAQLRSGDFPDCVSAIFRKIGFRDVGSQVYMVGTDAQTDRIMVRAL